MQPDQKFPKIHCIYTQKWNPSLPIIDMQDQKYTIKYSCVQEKAYSTALIVS